MTSYRPIIAGNWKMHGLEASLAEVRVMVEAVEARPPASRVAICPSATLIRRLTELVGGTLIEVGGQDCRAEVQGAFTGDVSAEMLADAGAALVILGHSERRAGYGETSVLVAAKAQAALRAGLEPIVCVGETLAEREAGRTLEVITGQTADSLPDALGGHRFAVAYEPVWAIGTGLTPTLEQIEEAHGAIRATLAAAFGEQGRAIPILYGGSVKPSNAAEILKVANVGGALVGGASLKAADFIPIFEAL
ncbi:MAG TPA: triose-phosphate isomerase [Caulobacteraceae bacterium]